MSRRLAVVLLASLCAAASPAARQRGPAPDTARPVVLGHSFTVSAGILKQSVPVDVNVPRDYATGQARYPVLLAFMTRLPAVAGIVDGLADLHRGRRRELRVASPDHRRHAVQRWSRSLSLASYPLRQNPTS